MRRKGPSLTHQILAFLSALAESGKGYSRKDLWAKWADTYRQQSIHNAFSLLQKQGAIEWIGEDKARLTDRGRKQWKHVARRHPVFEKQSDIQSKNKLIVMYDIPESRKGEREWFRFHLRIFGYRMIQRSVWIGPSPLPRDFLKYVQSIGLSRNIHTFMIQK